jgi:kumamolisin
VTGDFLFENGWQEAGGGQSAYENRPTYQNGVAYMVGSQRGVPDVSSDANPNTGVWVLDTLVYGPGTWYIVGGTSVSSPTWAGIVNAAGGFSPNTHAELTKVYSDRFGDFNDITYGTCGPYMAYLAFPGWDFCSGLGSPESYRGK